jgi:tetraacyldisaccharide 4'-kinase
LGLPFVALCGIALSVRHALYDWGILRSHTFDFPVICVGNLAVGGTGKTPHTLLIANILQKENIEFAILSRGYKRKSKGFRYVENTASATEVGDEPLLIKRNVSDAVVVVCKNRVRAIRRIKQEHPEVRVIVLDDALQYRKLNAGLSVLLTPYNRLMTHDTLLPAGRLRDLSSRRHKSDIVIATQCPDTLQPIDFNMLQKNLKLYPYQQLYCTRYLYSIPVSLATGKEVVLQKNSSVIGLAGIAHPQPFLDYLKKSYTLAHFFVFADHHHFAGKDVQKIRLALQQRPDSFIITTEKDAVRLLDCGLHNDELQRIVYQPIKIQFLKDKQVNFSQNILYYVRENKTIGLFC